MYDELIKAKNVDECIEMATVDTYSEEEAASGWLACFEDLFSDVQKVKVFGEIIPFSGFNLANNNRNEVVAICVKKGRKAKITLDSIEFIRPTKAQKLWIKAWPKWKGYQ